MASVTTVEDYLAALPDDRRAAMEELRQTIKAAAPEASETISYQMPAFKTDGRFLVSFAAFKAHYSLFPASEAVVEALGEEVQPYLAGKGTIRFRADQPIPVATVTRIVKIRVAENAARDGRDRPRPDRHRVPESQALDHGPQALQHDMRPPHGPIAHPALSYSRHMTNETLDAPILGNTDPSLARPHPPALAGARADLIAAARDLLAIPEAALARPWTWIGSSEQEVRYGAYRAAEALEEAEIEARAATSAGDATERQTARIIGPTTAARWDLHGLLVPLDERLLDADPGGGEWSIRLVMGHVIAGQRGYAWGNAWVQAHGPDPEDPSRQVFVDESFWDALPDEATTEAAGSIDDLLARLDIITDQSADRLAGIPDDKLAIPTRWSGFPVSLGFRFGRWASHIREHSIQIEKTLALLGHVPDEPALLARNVFSAYGRAEAVVFGRQNVDDAVDRVAAGAAEARQAVHAAREAAGV